MRQNTEETHGQGTGMTEHRRGRCTAGKVGKGEIEIVEGGNNIIRKFTKLLPKFATE